VSHNLEQGFNACLSEDMTAILDMSDAEGSVRSVAERLANETQVTQVCAVDGVGNLTEELCWKRKDNRHDVLGDGCRKERRPI